MIQRRKLLFSAGGGEAAIMENFRLLPLSTLGAVMPLMHFQTKGKIPSSVQKRSMIFFLEILKESN